MANVPTISSGWDLGFGEDDSLHILPHGDLRDHMDADCPCAPVFDKELGAWSHNSFDGREAFDNGERKPS